MDVLKDTTYVPFVEHPEAVSPLVAAALLAGGLRARTAEPRDGPPGATTAHPPWRGAFRA